MTHGILRVNLNALRAANSEFVDIALGLPRRMGYLQVRNACSFSTVGRECPYVIGGNEAMKQSPSPNAQSARLLRFALNEWAYCRIC